MVILDVRLKKIYGFDEFHMNFSYPRKLSASLLGNETLEGRSRFRYKKAVILMGTNATGKTSLGKALLKIFSSIREANEAILRDLPSGDTPAEFQVDFVNEGYVLHRFSGIIEKDNVNIRYFAADIEEMDSYEMTVLKLEEKTAEINGSLKELRKTVGTLRYRFAYPEIEKSLRVKEIGQEEMLRTLRAVIGTLDPTLTDVSIAKDLKDSFVIRRRGEEIIIQDGNLLNRDLLSSGTAEGINYYPTLPDHPYHGLCQTELGGRGGGILTFRTGSRQRAFDAMKRLKYAVIASNIGDVRTLVLHPASTLYRNRTEEERSLSGVEDDTVRVSVGIEESEDLIADFTQALTS